MGLPPGSLHLDTFVDCHGAPKNKMSMFQYSSFLAHSCYHAGACLTVVRSNQRTSISSDLRHLEQSLCAWHGAVFERVTIRFCFKLYGMALQYFRSLEGTIVQQGHPKSRAESKAKAEICAFCFHRSGKETAPIILQC